MNGQALRIFAHAPRRRSLVRPGRPQPVVVPVPAVVEVEVEAEVEVDIEAEPELIVETAEPIVTIGAEQTILDILAGAPEVGETIEAAYRRKERALADAFGALTRSEAATLQRRLSEPRAEDVLAQRFGRLVVDRRTRLLAILADIPRREARRR